MKERITEESIKSLQQEGLRFSVDTLAERLRISKKTIYKYFPAKEDLAYAIYEKYYGDLNEKIRGIIQSGGETMTEKLLLCYFDSAKMVREEIFNKYSLNRTIGDFARQQHLAVWSAISPCVCGNINGEVEEICKLVTDGAFDKAIARNADPGKVIEVLRRIK